MADRDNFIISTLNVNGLKDLKKRRDIFNFLREKGQDIYLLQETHMKQKDTKFVRMLWGYDLYLAGNSTNSNGVAILFNSTFEHKVHKTIVDPEGHYLILDMELLDKRLTLVNIYGPSAGDNPDIFNKVEEHILEIDNETTIIGGDWNCILKHNIDARNYASIQNRPNIRRKIINCMEKMDLVDIYREIYPEKREYTWRKFNSIKQGRLDYFLISQDIASEVTDVQINPGYRTDHSMVTLTMKREDFKRDRPFWKFNNSLLKDRIFLEQIKEVINRTIKQYAVPIYDLDNLNKIPAHEIHFTITDQLFFEVLLMEIRGKSISYASYKKKKENIEEKELNRTLTELENTNLTQETAEKIETIKEDLQLIRDKRMEGIITRSKVQWIDKGEKPSKYFFNLEKGIS